MQYTTGMGLHGGSLLSGWRAAAFKEWTASTVINAATGMPLTPQFPGIVQGTGVPGSIRPDYTGASLYDAPSGLNLNPAAFTAPAPGQWGNAGRNSITGPSQFSLNAAAQRTFRINDRFSATLQISSVESAESPDLPQLGYLGLKCTVRAADCRECDAERTNQLTSDILMKTRRVLTTCFLIALAVGVGERAGAQQPANTPGQNTPVGADGVATFKTSTQLVIETVGVKDKSGKPIEGLTAKDFIVTEDGMPQTISFFEYQKLPEDPAAPILSTATNTATALVASPMAKLPRTQIAPERPGDVRYRDRRLLALYFDMVAMPIPDQLRALDAAQKFIRTQMTPADLVAIMMFDNGAVRVLQDFTEDRERLLSIIETMAVGEDENVTVTDDSSADTGAAFGQNDAEFNIFFTDRELSALQTAASMLGKLNEKKALIYFASGLRLNGADNQAQLHATTNAAIKAGVQFWSIDARGLMASAPMGDASKGSPGGQAMYTGSSAMTAMTNFQTTQDTLVDAGGRYRRQSPSGCERPFRGDRQRPKSFFELLHPRILHQQCEPRREIPPHQDFAAGGRVRRPGLPAGLLRGQGVQQILDRR